MVSGVMIMSESPSAYVERSGNSDQGFWVVHVVAATDMGKQMIERLLEMGFFENGGNPLGCAVKPDSSDRSAFSIRLEAWYCARSTHRHVFDGGNGAFRVLLLLVGGRPGESIPRFSFEPHHRQGWSRLDHCRADHHAWMASWVRGRGVRRWQGTWLVVM